ncbi:MAG: small nuclear ribonucleoprotein [Candidatus Thermoplasmatota archaeon]|nr:small nuclear ribonucleoprotein [Candidatus Thermoplasmatota archaeon]
MKKPLTVLNDARGKNIIACLRGGREYHGLLDGYDPHMNLVMKNTDEKLNGEKVANHQTIIVRGDNVIYISP